MPEWAWWLIGPVGYTHIAFLAGVEVLVRLAPDGESYCAEHGIEVPQDVRAEIIENLSRPS